MRCIVNSKYNKYNKYINTINGKYSKYNKSKFIATEYSVAE